VTQAKAFIFKEHDMANNTGRSLKERAAWLPIPLAIMVIAGLWIAGLRTAYPQPYFHWFIHYGSVILGISLIVIPASCGFIASGQPSLLMLGCGILVMDIGVITMPKAFAYSSNAAFAIYNSSVLLSALCHFAGVTISTRRTFRLKHSATLLAGVYMGGMAVMGLIIWAAFTNRMPIFFIENQGGTLLRSLMIGASVIFFILTAGILWSTNRRAASPFLYWYALGLTLLSTGLAGSMLIAVTDSLLQWVTRTTQFIGAAYMYVAVLVSTRKNKTRELPLTKVEETWREKELPTLFRKNTLGGSIACYSLTIFVVTLAMFARAILINWTGDGLPPYVLFYPAVTGIAILGGIGPGLVATLLSAFFAAFWILAPVGQFTIESPAERFGLVIFIGMGVFLSFLAEFYKRVRIKAAEYNKKSALRKSEEKYHTLFETMAEGFALHEIITDAQGKPCDYLFIEVNPAFERLTGFKRADLIGKRVREVMPGIESYWIENYGKVALTGEHLQTENYSSELKRCFSVIAYSTAPGYFAVIFTDITARKQIEKALRQKETELNEAQRIVHIGSWYWDAKTDVTTGSDDLLRIYGLDPKTESMPAFKEQKGWLYPDESWEVVNAAVQKTLQTGAGYNLEVEANHKNTLIWIETRGEAVRDTNGQVIGLRGIVQDITERKNVEKTLRKNEEELIKLNRTLKALSDSSQAMMRAENEESYLNEVCNIIIRDCGYAMTWIGFAEQNEAKTVRPIAQAGFEEGYLKTVHITWADTERGRGPTGTAIRTGKPCFCRNMLTDPDFKPWKQEALTRGYASSMVLPLISDDVTFGAITIYSKEPDPFTQKEVQLLSELADDLAHGIHALRLRTKVAQAEQQFRLAIDNMPDSVALYDGQRKYTYVNQAGLKRSGLPLEAFIGRRLEEIFGTEVTGPLLPILIKTYETKTAQTSNAVIDLSTGQYYLTVTFIPILKDGQIEKVLSFSLDLTERKKVEDILKRDKETFERLVQDRTRELVETQMELEKAKRLSDIGVLAATVAHELRNPLVAIGMAAHNIKRKANNPDIEKHIVNIDKKVAESDQIINNLLFYSRLKPPHYEKVNIFGLVEESIEALENKLKKTISIIRDIDLLKEISIDADPLQIKEVFNNILNNAYDAVLTDIGEIKIDAENENEFVKITVKDNGGGIKKESLEKVFDPFFTTKAKGTGLGLSVCRQIVDFHDGAIYIESEIGKGTTVTVSLPKEKISTRGFSALKQPIEG